MRKFLIALFGILLGVGVAYTALSYSPRTNTITPINPLSPKKEVIGFLPYWLLDKADKDYSKYINTLTYFGLKVGTDGKIMRYNSPTEKELGWNALDTGKVDKFLQDAKNSDENLSLLISNGNVDSINALVENPVRNARNLVSDVEPIMDRYGFTDLNIDIEYTSQASTSARENFTKFIQEVKNNLKPSQTLTVEITSIDVVKPYLIDPVAVSKIADKIVIMTYDYHSTDSFVTGPVAPLLGAGTESEFDVQAAIEKALEIMPAQKLILGVPTYGYEWEALSPVPRSAIIPSTGVVVSNRRAEELLTTCSSCSAVLDKSAEESYISYYDDYTQDYHIMFYPDKNSTEKKVKFANDLSLGGIAIWALGYEGDNMLSPLEGYK